MLVPFVTFFAAAWSFKGALPDAAAVHMGPPARFSDMTLVLFLCVLHLSVSVVFLVY